MPSSEYNGLTHECEDAECHVGGFVSSLKLQDAERAKRGLDDLQDQQPDTIRTN